MFIKKLSNIETSETTGCYNMCCANILNNYFFFILSGSGNHACLYFSGDDKPGETF